MDGTCTIHRVHQFLLCVCVCEITGCLDTIQWHCESQIVIRRVHYKSKKEKDVTYTISRTHSISNKDKHYQRERERDHGSNRMLDTTTTHTKPHILLTMISLYPLKH